MVTGGLGWTGVDTALDSGRLSENIWDGCLCNVFPTYPESLDLTGHYWSPLDSRNWSLLDTLADQIRRQIGLRHAHLAADPIGLELAFGDQAPHSFLGHLQTRRHFADGHHLGAARSAILLVLLGHHRLIYVAVAVPVPMTTRVEKGYNSLGAGVVAGKVLTRVALAQYSAAACLTSTRLNWDN